MNLYLLIALYWCTLNCVNSSQCDQPDCDCQELNTDHQDIIYPRFRQIYSLAKCANSSSVAVKSIEFTTDLQDCSAQVFLDSQCGYWYSYNVESNNCHCITASPKQGDNYCEREEDPHWNIYRIISPTTTTNNNNDNSAPVDHQDTGVTPFHAVYEDASCVDSTADGSMLKQLGMVDTWTCTRHVYFDEDCENWFVHNSDTNMCECILGTSLERASPDQYPCERQFMRSTNVYVVLLPTDDDFIPNNIGYTPYPYHKIYSDSMCTATSLNLIKTIHHHDITDLIDCASQIYLDAECGDWYTYNMAENICQCVITGARDQQSTTNVHGDDCEPVDAPDWTVYRILYLPNNYQIAFRSNVVYDTYHAVYIDAKCADYTTGAIKSLGTVESINDCQIQAYEDSECSHYWAYNSREYLCECVTSNPTTGDNYCQREQARCWNVYFLFLPQMNVAPLNWNEKNRRREGGTSSYEPTNNSTGVSVKPMPITTTTTELTVEGDETSQNKKEKQNEYTSVFQNVWFYLLVLFCIVVGAFGTLIFVKHCDHCEHPFHFIFYQNERFNTLSLDTLMEEVQGSEFSHPIEEYLI